MGISVGRTTAGQPEEWAAKGAHEAQTHQHRGSKSIQGWAEGNMWVATGTVS